MNKERWFNKIVRDGCYVYYDKVELSSKQVALINFTQNIKEKEYLYSVAFNISNKKRHFVEETISTGRCGLEGLIWAKNKILEFEKWLMEDTWRSDSKKKIKIEIKWADQRRRKVYMWAMTRHGYKFDPYQKRIFKIIN